MTEDEIKHIARVAHEANRAWCIAMDDFSQLHWPAAPGWQVRSAIEGVRFHLENPDASASASHDAWRKAKREDGWTWGSKKDPNAKTHPCMVAFEDLPEAQQKKDVLFKAIVDALR